MPTPTFGQYTIGRGVVTVGGVDIGNCPTFAFKQSNKTKQRFRAVAGVRYPMDSIVTDASASIEFTLDDWNSNALTLAKAGAVGAAVVITQTNDVGPRKTWTFSKVNIPPSDAMTVIGDDWSTMSFTGEVLFDSSGAWGTIA